MQASTLKIEHVLPELSHSALHCQLIPFSPAAIRSEGSSLLIDFPNSESLAMMQEALAAGKIQILKGATYSKLTDNLEVLDSSSDELSFIESLRDEQNDDEGQSSTEYQILGNPHNDSTNPIKVNSNDKVQNFESYPLCKNMAQEIRISGLEFEQTPLIKQDDTSSLVRVLSNKVEQKNEYMVGETSHSGFFNQSEMTGRDETESKAVTIVNIEQKQPLLKNEEEGRPIKKEKQILNSNSDKKESYFFWVTVLGCVIIYMMLLPSFSRLN